MRHIRSAWCRCGWGRERSASWRPPAGRSSPARSIRSASVVAIAIERIQFLEERRQAELAQRSAEFKSALLASLAHDLRTPLTTIRVAASNLHASWLTDVQREEQADLVVAEVERLTRLFQNILEMTRIEAGAVVHEPPMGRSVGNRRSRAEPDRADASGAHSIHVLGRCRRIAWCISIRD